MSEVVHQWTDVLYKKLVTLPVLSLSTAWSWIIAE